jgi:peptidyl-Asp metalloendopeptidase
MANRHSNPGPPGARLEWMALAAAVSVSLAGCAVPLNPGAVVPASTDVRNKAPSPVIIAAEPADAKVLFDAVKWEQIGGSYAEVTRQTTLTIDVKALETEDVLRSQLPDTPVPLVFRTIKRTKRANGTLIWSGSVNNSRYETATFAIVDGILTGSIMAPNGRAYRIRHLQGNQYLLQEIDRSKFPREVDCLEPRTIRGELPQTWQVQSVNALVQGSACIPEDPGDSIDVMVVYTNGALKEAGTLATMEGAIENAFSQTNTSYEHSGIQQRLVPIYPFMPIQYTEGSSITKDLARLTNVNNPQLSIIHAQRVVLAADIVVLVTKDSDACGLADVMTTVSAAFADRAFAVVPYRCLTDSFSFAHELGHLMGARHDINQDATGNSPYPFNHGFVQTQPTGSAPHPWFTVMGTQTLCDKKEMSNCARIDFWSTPDTLFDYQGDVTGVANQADNRQTLNATASTVANFMCSSTRVQLAVPSRPAPPDDEAKLEQRQSKF